MKLVSEVLEKHNTNHVDKWGGRGVAQMSTLLNKSYIVKVSTKGGRIKNVPNSVYVVCTQPLWESFLKMMKFDLLMTLNSSFSSGILAWTIRMDPSDYIPWSPNLDWSSLYIINGLHPRRPSSSISSLPCPELLPPAHWFVGEVNHIQK